MYGSGSTSATLAVNGRIDHFVGRTGLAEAAFEQFPSPFDYEKQALLALPKDLPAPESPEWLDAVWSVLYGTDRDYQNVIQASEGNREYMSTVLRLQLYE